MVTTIASEKAPAAVGPYSHAARCGGLLFLSGQIGLDPASGRLVEGGVEAETRQALANLDAVLAAAGSTRDRIVKATIYLTEMESFAVVNRLYAEWLGGHRPARATVAVAALPLGARVEIELIAEA